MKPLRDRLRRWPIKMAMTMKDRPGRAIFYTNCRDPYEILATLDSMKETIKFNAAELYGAQDFDTSHDHLLDPGAALDPECAICGAEADHVAAGLWFCEECGE